MRKCLCLILLVCSMEAFCANIVERAYIATDKDCYVAGEDVWCSAFCFSLTASERRLSTFSSTLYLELQSADGQGATAKLALQQGRGAGTLSLPLSLPTGNYRLIAYTATDKNEQGYDYMSCSRIITVFNTLSTDRVSSGVEVVPDEDYPSRENCRGIESEDISLTLSDVPGRRRTINIKGIDATLCVSVCAVDDIIPPEGSGRITEFNPASEDNPAFESAATPEYEGEIITARVKGNVPEGTWFSLASPGDISGLYFAQTDADGMLKFFTANIFSDKDLVLGTDAGCKDCRVELVSPFVNPSPAAIPTLKICKSLSSSLLRRSMAMQLTREFDTPGMFSGFPYKSAIYINGSKRIHYSLDDYTRFATLEETFTEYVPELKVKGGKGEKSIVTVLHYPGNNTFYSNPGTALVLLDGSPVYDMNKFLEYNPASVKSIDIYPCSFFLSSRPFNGIVNFVTFKGNMPGFIFPEGTTIAEFRGEALPRAYTCASVAEDDNYPDYRHTLYWNPLVDLSSSGFSADVVFPSYGGKFRVKVEGVTSEGKAVLVEKYFDLN